MRILYIVIYYTVPLHTDTRGVVGGGDMHIFEIPSIDGNGSIEGSFVKQESSHGVGWQVVG